ncbi:transposase [Streptomyces niveus]|uniref:transposase n=1 Tax=Streptomyces niveus TaxID=193462 RepID=UPI0036D9A853
MNDTASGQLTSVDSTIVRANQHAAGARTDPPSAPAEKGEDSAEHPGRAAVAESRRPPGGGGAGGEGLGRSRGGFTTKLHLSADGCCRPLSLIVTAGQRADCTQFRPVLEKIRVPRPGPGRPRNQPDNLAADKAHATGPVANTCGNAASGTRSRRRATARTPASAKDRAADGHRASTRSGTRNATPSSGPSTSSNTHGSWRLATTSAGTSSSAP